MRHPSTAKTMASASGTVARWAAGRQTERNVAPEPRLGSSQPAAVCVDDRAADRQSHAHAVRLVVL